MPKLLKYFILSLVLTATFLSVYWFSHSSIQIDLLMYFIILIILAEVYKVPVIIYGSSDHVKISWSLVISISVLIGCGVSEAIIVNLVGGLFCSVYPKRLPFIKVTFNISSYVASIAITYTVFQSISKINPVFLNNGLMEIIFIPLIYLICNFTISAMLMKIVTTRRLKNILLDFISPHYHHYLLFGFIGGIQGYFYKSHGVLSLVLTSIIITVVLYSFKSTAATANNRIKELEESTNKSRELANEFDDTLEQFIQTLTATVDARDPYTYGHSLQVSNYALALASELKLPDQEIEMIRIAGLLHDIGKISIPENILFKEGRLTAEEYEVMKQHAIIGQEILSDIPRLSGVAKLVGMHHERYNGSGYPHKLKGTQIPIGAHILGVSDTLDAILSNRSYKNERTVEEAITEFKRCRGKEFHPLVVDALISIRDRIGDDSFKNSARLIDESIIIGKVKTNRVIKQNMNNEVPGKVFPRVVS